MIPYYISTKTCNSLIIFDFIPWTKFSGAIAHEQVKGFTEMIQNFLRADVMSIFDTDKPNYSSLTAAELTSIRLIASNYDNILLSGDIGMRCILTQPVEKRTKKGSTWVEKPIVSKLSDGSYDIFFQQLDSKIVRVGLTQSPAFWSVNTIENFFNILGADMEFVREATLEYKDRSIPWKEIHTLAELKKFTGLEKDTARPFAFDLETTGVSPWMYWYHDNKYVPGNQRKHTIMSCSVCSDTGVGAGSFLIEHPRFASKEGLAMFQWLISLSNPKVAHNAKFEYIWTEKFYKIPVAGQLRDTELISHWLDENMGSGTGRYSLAGTIALRLKKIPHKGDFLSTISTGLSTKKYAAIEQLVTIKNTGKESTREDILGLKRLAEMQYRPEIREKDFSLFSREDLHQYGCYDALSTLAIYEEEMRLLKNIDLARAHMTGKKKDSTRILFYLQDRMIRTLGTMEWNGMRCDTDATMTIIDKCDADYTQAEASLNAAALAPNVDWGSSKSLSFYIRQFFPELVPVLKETAKGDLQLDKASLKLVSEKYPWVLELLSYRHALKAKSTYMTAFYRFSTRQRVHFSFNIDGTATGRLSSDRPNMQNIPKKIAGIPIKKVLLPESNTVLYNIDLSSAEVRMLANYCTDEGLSTALNTGGLDPHCHTASKISPYSYDQIMAAKKRDKVPGAVLTPDEVTALGWRKAAKCVTFGTIYGMTSKALAEDLQIDESEAENIIQGFYRAYPGVKNWIDQVRRDAQQFGYVETIFGRRRNFKMIQPLQTYLARNSFFMIERMLRQAVNYLIQGTTSDFFQMLLHELTAIPGLTLHITVHDSVVFSLDETKTDIHALYKYCDEIFYDKPRKIFGDFLKVPMQYDVSRGFDYGEMLELDRKKILSGELIVEPNGQIIKQEKKEAVAPVPPLRRKLVRVRR
jgi:DNA polymerase I-like protein with 3'-5' exonuclease and polymerase domains